MHDVEALLEEPGRAAGGGRPGAGCSQCAGVFHADVAQVRGSGGVGGWAAHCDCGSGVDQRVVADPCSSGSSSSLRAAPMALKAGPKDLAAGRLVP